MSVLLAQKQSLRGAQALLGKRKKQAEKFGGCTSRSKGTIERQHELVSVELLCKSISSGGATRLAVIILHAILILTISGKNTSAGNLASRSEIWQTHPTRIEINSHWYGTGYPFHWSALSSWVGQWPNIWKKRHINFFLFSFHYFSFLYLNIYGVIVWIIGAIVHVTKSCYKNNIC